MPNYQTIALRDFINQCAEIKTCDKLIESLKNQKPLGTNYYHRIYEGDGTLNRTGDACTRKVYRVFEDYNYSNSFWECIRADRKAVFCRTDWTFGNHFQIYNLEPKCQLMVSEAQNNIIQALMTIKEAHEKEELNRLLPKPV